MSDSRVRSADREFGTRVSGVTYVLRPGGYAVIFDVGGSVAVVSTPSGLALPGGGQDERESPEEAAIREVAEECGLRITTQRLIGVADELVFAAGERTYYRKRCTFFLAERIGTVEASEPDHELMWITPRDAEAKLRHQSQQWAVSEAFRLIQH